MTTQEVNAYLWILAQVLNKAFGISAENLHEDYIDDFFEKEYHITAMAIADDKFGMRGFIIQTNEEDLQTLATPKWTPLEVFPNVSSKDILLGDKEGYVWKTKYCCYTMYLINDVCGAKLKNKKYSADALVKQMIKIIKQSNEKAECR